VIPLILNVASIGWSVYSKFEVLLTGTLVTGIAYFVLLVYPAWIAVKITSALAITGYALSVSTTTLSTIIIVTRILLVSQMPGASKKSRSAAEIITESAALYTISALIYIAIIPGNFYYGNYADVFFAYCHEIFNSAGGVTCDPPAELYHSADLRVTCDMPEISADTEFSS
jgi:hypothetical protein